MSDELPKALGDVIRYQRELAALSVRQLAQMVGISNPYLSQIENGLRAPREQVLRNISASLGLDPEQLRTETGDDARPDVVLAIKSDPDLTAEQRHTLVSVYRSMVVATRATRAR